MRQQRFFSLLSFLILTPEVRITFAKKRRVQQFVRCHNLTEPDCSRPPLPPPKKAAMASWAAVAARPSALAPTHPKSAPSEPPTSERRARGGRRVKAVENRAKGGGPAPHSEAKNAEPWMFKTKMCLRCAPLARSLPPAPTHPRV